MSIGRVAPSQARRALLSPLEPPHQKQHYKHNHYNSDQSSANIHPLERFPLGVNRDSQGDREGRVLAGDSPM
jgi:hypothetical protein